MSKFKDSWGKAKILLSQLLCIGAVFSACTDDEIFNQTNKALQVSVSTEAPAKSRAIIDGGYLPDGASIGVTLTAVDGTAYDGQAFTNLQYTAAGEGSAQTWSSATPASLSITAGKVIAYYPYYGGDDFDLKAVPVETASQTDYMYAKPVTDINMVSPGANLTMQHAMTDIRINVKKGTYTGTGEVTKITAKAPAFATSATMDVETGVFANVSGGGAQFVQELTGTTISSGNVVHDFLIVPDAKSTSGEVSIFIIIDGKKFAVTVPYTESFQQGFVYTYNLTLDNAALTLDGVSVAKWGVKAEVDESLQFIDDQYNIEIKVSSNNYNYKHNILGFVGTIDWGDGTTEIYTTSTNIPSHTYTLAGNYTVITEGEIDKIKSYDSSKIITKLIRIGKEMGITSMDYAFSGQTLLTEIVPGALDGCTEVMNFSYAFQECRSLKIIPSGLFDKCTEAKYFGHVFSSCSVLTSIPEGLFDKCTKVTGFDYAFNNCTSLTSIPQGLFDYNTLVKDFYWAFENCSKITEIPQGLFDNCTEVTKFSGTFNGCSNITSIPEGLFDNCTEVTTFYATFGNCGSLIAIPEGLFDNNTKVTSFNATFSKCINLQTIPEGLFDKCTEVTDFGSTGNYEYGCFYNCIKLTNIPEGLFDFNTKAVDFKYTFSGCKSLQSIPEGLFDKCVNATDFGYVFYGCASLIAIPEGLFDKCTKVTDFGGTFESCSSLISIPSDLFDYNTEVTKFSNTFTKCSSLTSIPEGLFDKCTKVTTFNQTFRECRNIKEIPESLFDKCTEVTSFSGTFGRCSGLTSIPEGLFDNNTKVSAFYETFTYCGITNISSKLFKNCTEVTNFSYTFYGCTGLKEIPAGIFDYNTKVSSFSGIFKDCRNLTGESPYTIINVDGQDVKVHLYERTNYPVYFTAPTSSEDCFYNCTGLTDYNSIPSNWL